jgi:hypothetical protein
MLGCSHFTHGEGQMARFYQGTEVIRREEVMRLLIEEYGENCYLCNKPPTSTDVLNIDHYYPQAYYKQLGVDESVYNEISNLRPSHESCNRQKSDTVPYDGWIFTPPEPKQYATKVAKREPCETCYEGHLLYPGETCEDCGSGAMPAAFPASLQKKPKDCDHEHFHCWACGPIGLIPRRSAFQVVVQGPRG